MARRQAVQEALDAALSKPVSYSIQGSYSQTGQSADALRAELAIIDASIHALGGVGGIARQYPDYSGDPRT